MRWKIFVFAHCTFLANTRISSFPKSGSTAVWGGRQLGEPFTDENCQAQEGLSGLSPLLPSVLLCKSSCPCIASTARSGTYIFLKKQHSTMRGEQRNKGNVTERKWHRSKVFSKLFSMSHIEVFWAISSPTETAAIISTQSKTRTVFKGYVTKIIRGMGGKEKERLI